MEALISGEPAGARRVADVQGPVGVREPTGAGESTGVGEPVGAGEPETAWESVGMGERAEARKPTDIRDRAALTALVAEGARVKWLMFWGHRPQADGSLGPGCLSQWYPSPFTVGGVTYPTAEHWMMTAKARLFSDDVMAARIPVVATPAEAKKLGRLVSGFDNATWDGTTTRSNLSSTPALRDYLLGTRSRVPVEASLAIGSGASACPLHTPMPPTRRAGADAICSVSP